MGIESIEPAVGNQIVVHTSAASSSDTNPPNLRRSRVDDLWPYLRRGPPVTMGSTKGDDTMHASVGDRIIIKGHRLGEPDRDCEVLEVRGKDGEPPYIVRWADSGQEAFFFPGNDASVQHFDHQERLTARR